MKSNLSTSPSKFGFVVESTKHLVARLLESDDLDDHVLDLDTDNPYFNDFDFAEVCGIIAEVLGGQPSSFNFEREVLPSTNRDHGSSYVSVTITFRLSAKRKIISLEQWQKIRGRIKDYIGDTKDCKAAVYLPGRAFQKQNPSAIGRIELQYCMP